MKWKSYLAKVEERHIGLVLEEIKTGRRPVPRGRRARKWLISCGKTDGPTKYVLARAVELATGRVFPPSARSGGNPTVSALKKILKNNRSFRIFKRI
jgi:hypothetical protein